MDALKNPASLEADINEGLRTKNIKKMKVKKLKNIFNKQIYKTLIFLSR